MEEMYNILQWTMPPLYGKFKNEILILQQVWWSYITFPQLLLLPAQ